MAARMQPQPQRRFDVADDSHVELAQIVAFPATEWDRLERLARKRNAEQHRELAARNVALSRI